MNNLAKREMPSRFVISPPVSLGKEWHMGKHKKFPSKAHHNPKEKDEET